MLHTPSNIAAALAFFVAVLCTASAFAQDDKERAQKLYKEGAEAYYTDDYTGAIMKFKSGYALDPDPMFLYNIAVSYGRLGNFDEAYQNALQAEQDGLPREAADKNAARLNSWGLTLQATQIAERLGSTDESDGCTTDAECGEDMTCDTTRNVCQTNGADLHVKNSETDSGGLSALGWTGVALGVAGVGLITTSIILDAGLTSDFDALDQARASGDTQAQERLEEDIESTQSTGKILLFAGAGAAAVGITLLVIDLLSGDEESSTATFSPMVGPDQAGAIFSTRF